MTFRYQLSKACFRSCMGCGIVERDCAGLVVSDWPIPHRAMIEPRSGLPCITRPRSVYHSDTQGFLIFS